MANLFYRHDAVLVQRGEREGERERDIHFVPFADHNANNRHDLISQLKKKKNFFVFLFFSYVSDGSWIISFC